MTEPEPDEGDGSGLLALLVVDGALLGAFTLAVNPLYAGPVPLPMGAVLAILILPWLVLRAGEVDPRPQWAGAPAFAWFLVLGVLGFTGPGGDVLLGGTWQPVLLIFGGVGTRLLDFLATVEVPGTAAWAAMDVTARSRWWVRRVGRFTTLLAAVPGIGGALAKRFPVSSAIGAAGQGLLLVAIAGEHGVRDEDELVALLGTVLFRRDLTVRPPEPAADSVAATRAAELAGELDRKPGLQRLAGTVWRLGRALLAVEDELGKRPRGNLVQRLLGELPVVGVVGTYLGEWSGLKRAAREAERLLARDSGSGGAR